MMKNHEGYHDPTAGKAIRRAQREKFSCSRKAALDLLQKDGYTKEVKSRLKDAGISLEAF